MKITNIIRSIVVGSVLTLALHPVSAAAEDKPAAPRGGMPLKKMQAELSLTQDQVEELKIIQEGQRAKVEALRKNESLTPEQRREQMRALRESGREEINSVLTPEQRQKFEQMRTKYRQMQRGEGRNAEQKPGQRPEGRKKPAPGTPVTE